MANNKKKRKRIKRQLKQRFKQTSGTVIVSIEPPKEYKAHILYKGKYDLENQAYQVQLDQVYGTGRITPIERFITHKSIILHECSECDHKFYSRPKWLLFKGDQRHVCGIDVGKIGDVKKSKRYLSDNDKLNITLLFEQGMSKSKIANELGFSRQTVGNYLNKQG
ncbi:Helix-turn-helix domain-containing protein [Peribacillus simplex]|uniref:Helix-turn-helix domain-containing protein n=1 Tax=Peribacillus simplex TaxID=1478 RepID=A0A9X8R9K8_9BACI|nr:helix-turn-helix domain-containing protein [Peribacillus simplex]SIR38098.1 Helix-turn-helix domain-containing protein [Peribacillus simplex]